MDNFLSRKRTFDDNKASTSAQTSIVPKIKSRKYSQEYLNFGFTITEVNGEEKRMCVICSKILAADSMKPNKLKRHFETLHGGRAPQFEKHCPNPRAVSTDWNAFRINLNNNLSLFDLHSNNINNTCDLEHKISEFTEAVIETHSHASRPIETDRRNFTPQYINRLLKLKNHLRKQYHQTLNPIFKTHYNRVQSDFKKELKKHNDSIWQKRLESLNTTDNSLWRTQKFFKNKRPKIPPLNCATGTAVTDQQKANLLATNIKNNFIENDRENDSYNQSDEIINSTLDNFLSTPPTTLIQPAFPDEIIHYIKHVNAKKTPGQPIGATVHFTQQPIREQLLSSQPRQKLLKNHHPDKAQKPRLPDPIVQPIVVMPLSRM
ncbi:putative RNA-directed DNA polymerase from transposon X-element [Trichonephila clavipes]|nr:putative RNA-directed DNA polymerase from transposon X-element [Trichonephila clavipes]